MEPAITKESTPNAKFIAELKRTEDKGDLKPKFTQPHKRLTSNNSHNFCWHRTCYLMINVKMWQNLFKYRLNSWLEKKGSQGTNKYQYTTIAPQTTKITF